MLTTDRRTGTPRKEQDERDRVLRAAAQRLFAIHQFCEAQIDIWRVLGDAPGVDTALSDQALCDLDYIRELTGIVPMEDGPTDETHLSLRSSLIPR
jgi:hypothetical protein